RRPPDPIADPLRAAADHVQTQRIPVPLAERPYLFPPRTRKSSSPGPKILRGQPFGKIGRRRDFLRFRAPETWASLQPGVSSGPMADIAAPGTALSTAPETAAVCPYLLGADGAWRASTAPRHRRWHAVATAALAI